MALPQIDNRLASVNRVRAHQRDWIAETRRRTAEGEPFAICNGDEFEEIFIAMGIPVLAINYWNFLIAAQGKTQHYTDVLHQHGYAGAHFFGLALASTLAPEEAPDDGEKRIEQWKGESHQRGGHAQDGGRFLAPEDTQAAEHEADEQAAGIAEEDGSGIEVVAKETEEGARQRGDGNGQREITVQQGGDESGDGGEQADTRSESVHAIDQIERIRAADEPQNSDGEGKPVTNGERSEVPDLDTAAIGDDGGETLAGELLPGLEMDEIVGEADGEYDQGGREQLDNKDQLGGEDAAGVERQNEEETEGGEVGDDDSDTADARNRTLVNFTGIAGRIDQPEPDGPVSEQGRQQEGDGERAQSEKG